MLGCFVGRFRASSDLASDPELTHCQASTLLAHTVLLLLSSSFRWFKILFRNIDVSSANRIISECMHVFHSEYSSRNSHVSMNKRKCSCGILPPSNRAIRPTKGERNDEEGCRRQHSVSHRAVYSTERPKPHADRPNARRTDVLRISPPYTCRLATSTLHIVLRCCSRFSVATGDYGGDA